MKIVAVIPVKENSERVQSKNFKEFVNGISLFELKIQHLIDSKSFDEIYISSDSKYAEEIAKKYGIRFIKRDMRFCNNITPWSEVIHEVVSSIPQEDVHIAWCHTTSPLFTNYKEAVSKYKETYKNNSNNGLVTVNKLSEFIVSEKARPVNYHWGVWHEYSQNLDKLYAITGALFIAHKDEMIKNRYVVSTKPYLFEVSAYEAIDIDTVYDFNLAKLMFTSKHSLLEGIC
jgi:N-acylneuraminate cytidylyltransferase